VSNFKPNFKCSPLQFLGDPDPVCGRASKHGQSLARLKFVGPAPPRGRNIVSRKSRLRWVQTHMSYFLGSEPKFAGLRSPNAGGIGLDHVPEICAIKVGSCVKSRQVLHVFGSETFFRTGPRFFGLAL